MSKRIIKYIIFALSILGLTGYILYIQSPDKTFPSDTGEYKPYIMGEQITFSIDGNSDLFVNRNDGWGEQEQIYRCTVSPDVSIKLYINNDEKYVKLKVLAAGSFPEPYKSQEVTVFANNKQIATWDVGLQDWYEATIPASLIPDNKIELRFNMAHPYTPDGDTRKLGMIVSEIKLDTMHLIKTKKNITQWFLRQLTNLFGEPSLEVEKATHTETTKTPQKQ